MTDLDPDLEFCPCFHEAVELIGKRWNGVILRALLAGHTRFGDIRDEVPHLSDTMLAERLKELESYGCIQRLVTPSTPVRITYLLTKKGQSLRPVIEAIGVWADEWLAQPSTTRPTAPSELGTERQPGGGHQGRGKQNLS